jgi:hypothetical protein
MAIPPVGVLFAPAVDIEETVLCPPDEMMPGLLREASSIVYHYAPMRSEDFAECDQPPIPGPLKKPRAPAHVHHAKIALRALLGRIQTMNEPTKYPTLSSLRSGSYICTVWISWSNAAHEVVLFRK